MTTEVWIKEILAKTRTIPEWKDLLNSVKTTTKQMSNDEKDYLIAEIEFKITGKRPVLDAALKDIEDGKADTDDMGGY